MRFKKETENKIREAFRQEDFQNFMFEAVFGESKDEDNELYKNVYKFELEEVEDRLVEKIVDMYAYYGFNTQVLAASIRHTQHIIQCIEAGADVATCPLSAIKGLLKHPLTDSGLATFLADHKKVNS